MDLIDACLDHFFFLFIWETRHRQWPLFVPLPIARENRSARAQVQKLLWNFCGTHVWESGRGENRVRFAPIILRGAGTTRDISKFENRFQNALHFSGFVTIFRIWRWKCVPVSVCAFVFVWSFDECWEKHWNAIFVLENTYELYIGVDEKKGFLHW